MSKTYAVTGHRPQSIPNYDFSKLQRLATNVLIAYKPDKVITGMALGWDIAIADTAYQLSIPYIAAIPFNHQDCKWNDEDRSLWEELVFLADEVVYVDTVDGYKTKNCEVGAYHVSKMHKRNKYIIDHCTNVLALYSGQESGGTYKCIEYAKSKNIPIANVWGSWLKYAV
jgi:uncharacterized phage-like protein YoqJ